jgi:hypothetical protein
MSSSVSRSFANGEPSAANSLRNSADCSGASRRATAWVAKCRTSSPSDGSSMTRRAVALNPASSMTSAPANARTTARASIAEYGRRASLSDCPSPPR